MKKVLNYLLVISFAITILVPFTGIHVHKLAAAVFLLISMVHVMTYRKKIRGKQWILLLLILFSFTSGLLGMILEQYPLILNMHRVSSIILVFFLGIHIFQFHKRITLK